MRAPGSWPLAETLVGKLRVVDHSNDALGLPITALSSGRLAGTKARLRVRIRPFHCPPAEVGVRPFPCAPRAFARATRAARGWHIGQCDGQLRPGRNGHARVRSMSVSSNSIVRPASGPRPLPFSPAELCAPADLANAAGSRLVWIATFQVTTSQGAR
eukprot:gene18187-biopygen2393